MAVCAASIAYTWYPAEYLELSGGVRLFQIIVFVDIILGPCLTLLVVHKKKSRKEIISDCSVIGVLQIVALVYGMWSIYAARPVYLVFEYHRMALVSAADLTKEDLLKAPVELRVLSNSGPRLLSLRNFSSPAEQYNSVVRAIAGQPQAAQPELWQSYEAGRVQVLEAAKPLSALAIASAHANRLALLVAESGVAHDQLNYLPLLGRKGDWIMLIDATTAVPKGMLDMQLY